MRWSALLQKKGHGSAWKPPQGKEPNRVEALTAVALDVAAWHIWRYRVPASERERLARMRNLLEARAVIEYRHRLGKGVEMRLLALADGDDVVEERLALIEKHNSHSHAFVGRVRVLRRRQWEVIHRLSITAERRWALAAQLNAIYIAHLEPLPLDATQDVSNSMLASSNTP